MNGSKKIKPIIGITVSLIVGIVCFTLGFSVAKQGSILRVRDYYYFRDGLGYDGICGVIENRSDKIYNNVSIKFVILGEMKIPIGTQDIYIGHMLPHRSYEFDEPVSKKFWNDYLNECKVLWIKGRP
jgi:hypothetical protein